MRIADVPQSAVDKLKIGLDQFLTGLGRVRLGQRDIALDHLNARGGIAEAQLGLEDLNHFLEATGDALDAFFTRTRVLLFDADEPIGSVGLLRDASGTYTVEHVSLDGAGQIVQGLTVAEQLPESADSEARLLQVPPVYLTALVLVRNGSSRTFLVLTPPYPEGAEVRTPFAFRQFVGRLLEGNRRVFPPAQGRKSPPSRR
jgi:hypothetical protein